MEHHLWLAISCFFLFGTENGRAILNAMNVVAIANLKDVMEWMISDLTLVSGVRLCIRNWLNFFSPSNAALNISSTLGKAF